MSNITVLGLGAMGSRMALQLLNAGHTLTVWNRSPEASISLKEKGAIVATSPAEAVASAEYVISMLRDDQASQTVWLDKKTGALNTIPQNAIAIESSTLTPEWVARLSKECSDKGIAFVDAPVAGSRPQADAAKLIYFVGAEASLFEDIRPLLLQMGAAVHHAGAVGAGAKIKLAVNALFGIQLATMGELLGFLKKADVDVKNALDIIGSTPVCSPAAKLSGEAMLAGIFSPAFPIELVEKDFSYVVCAAGKVKASLPQSEATHKVFQKAINEGYSSDNITSVVQLYIDG